MIDTRSLVGDDFLNTQRNSVVQGLAAFWSANFIPQLHHVKFDIGYLLDVSMLQLYLDQSPNVLNNAEVRAFGRPNGRADFLLLKKRLHDLRRVDARTVLLKDFVDSIIVLLQIRHKIFRQQSPIFIWIQRLHWSVFLHPRNDSGDRNKADRTLVRHHAPEHHWTPHNWTRNLQLGLEAVFSLSNVDLHGVWEGYHQRCTFAQCVVTRIPDGRSIRWSSCAKTLLLAFWKRSAPWKGWEALKMAFLESIDESIFTTAEHFRVRLKK